jgi:hypothetical protein
MPASGFSILVFIFILSLVLDRVVKAMLFLLSFVKFWAKLFPDPRVVDDNKKKVRAEKMQKLLYAVLVGSLGAFIVTMSDDVRLIKLLLIGRGEENPSELLDIIVTTVTLIGGSDLIGKLLQVSGISDIGAGAASATPKPIEITGKLVLENPDQGKVEAPEPAPRPKQEAA